MRTRSRGHGFDAGPVGIWTATLDPLPMPRAVELAREVEGLGFGTLWTPGDAGREALTAAAQYLAGTTRLRIGTGVASMYARDAHALVSGRRVLWEVHGDRYALGLGVSHASFADRRGHEFRAPLTAMTEYLQHMRDASARQQTPDSALTLIGALGPKMLQLAGCRTGGALTYNATLAHTEAARRDVGPDAFLGVTQVVIWADHDAEAREIGRRYLDFYLRLPNYMRHFERLGFTADDFSGRGSDRLIDELFVWRADAIYERVRAHLARGADHVALNVIAADRDHPPLEGWRSLTTVLSDWLHIDERPARVG
ncbi:TIGR03620 family F420-dependent LLM class oxidoreductase [Frankia tisae]|uniref:TIGR03620 family F420-dependent LLM class oxidoreductase n=1 Tax=Frankia tisae TaxID=2950104 RepID=UPI0021C110B0|nr:TIGR03620 family F420-dependent LLM class oxidoreductase [Frankia tisae]